MKTIKNILTMLGIITLMLISFVFGSGAFENNVYFYFWTLVFISIFYHVAREILDI